MLLLSHSIPSVPGDGEIEVFKSAELVAIFKTINHSHINVAEKNILLL